MKKNSKGFTLAEMIIALFVLAILAVGALRLFVNARTVHRKAVDLDRAVFETNRMIEEFHINGRSLDERFAAYYDEEWKPAEKDGDSACYAIYGSMTPLSEKEKGLYHLDLRVVRLKPYPFEKENEAEIYSISSIIEDSTIWSENP